METSCDIRTPGTINGGFFPTKPDWPAQYPSVIITWYDEPEDYRLEEVTRIDFGGRYEEALFLVNNFL